ncbi:GroES-like protein [Glonium stellatum]|uniref:GroES-like protein n=1 Tax=Glonium stellatum TaxID=574774 RepID=A0A8E2JZ36_9PEZI|nr:GroES-like protein [Glonium stellatum]
MVRWPLGSRRRIFFQNKQVNLEEHLEDFQSTSNSTKVPDTQSALLLPAIRQPYQLNTKYAIPNVEHDHELLVKVSAIGLNPIDWKAPDFNFGIPTLPYISGRELVGVVIQPPPRPQREAKSRIRKGDVVIIPSTDYRDLRKAAFQEYCIACSFNTIRLPSTISVESGSTLGVAFVASVLALGISMGVSFEGLLDGPDLLKIMRDIDVKRLPADIRKECLEGITEEERAKEGDFLVIWGGNATCAHTMKQLARLAGLRIISVADTRRHGIRLSNHASIRPDLLVDSFDPARAIEVVRAATGNSARFGFDTQGKDTAGHLLQILSQSDLTVSLPKDPIEYEAVNSNPPTPPSTPSKSFKSQSPRSHLIGLTGLPKGEAPNGMVFHSVPIKLFHEIPEVGEALSIWCEKLLVQGLLVPPDVMGIVDGLGSINDGLNRLRRREISGGRLVARLG